MLPIHGNSMDIYNKNEIVHISTARAKIIYTYIDNMMTQGFCVGFDCSASSLVVAVCFVYV